MRRRDLIRYGSTLFGVVAAAPLLSYSTGAMASGHKRLIVVFQRGGADGLNTVVPYGDDDYYALRPTLAIPSPTSGAPGSAVPIDHPLFALHPALAPLADIYHNGDLALMPAVHFPEATRSHFVNQEIIERGALDYASGGWLNRLLPGAHGGAELPAVSVGTSVAEALRGEVPVPVIQDLGFSTLAGEEFFNRLGAIYSQPVPASQTNRKAIHTHGGLMLQHRERFEDLTRQDYLPDNGASYPGSSFGKELRRLAQVIKSDSGLQFATVETYGWDTHRDQGAAEGSQARSLGNLADGIAALYTDLGPELMQDTLILTMTEFGRTAAENGSGGTDHGHAAAWFAVGGRIAGGVHGAWPGLAAANLVEDRFLAQSVDCRDVMCEIIARHLGRDAELSSLMPGHIYRPVGFL